MRKFLQKYLKDIAIIACGLILLTASATFADPSGNNWSLTSPNVLMTNTGSGLATAAIHVAACYIGTGTGMPCGGGGGHSPGVPLHGIQYNYPLGTFASDPNFTRTVGSLTNIADSFSSGETSAFQLNSAFSVPGIGSVPGAIMSHTAADGAAFVLAGDATGIGGPDNAIVSFAYDTSGNNSHTFQTSGQFQIGVSDGTNQQSAVQLQASEVKMVYQDTSGNPYGLKINSSGTHIVYSGTQIGTLPTTDGTNGQVLTTDGSGHWTFQNGGGGGSPGGSDTDVQYNNSGAFGGNSHFTWDYNTNSLLVGAGSTGNTFTVDNSGSTGITASMFGGNSFSVSEAPSGNYAFLVTPGANPAINMGDIGGIGHSTTFDLSDIAYRATLTADEGFYINNTAGDGWLAVDPNATGNNIALGDLNSVGNHNVFTISDSNQLINFQASNEFAITDANVAPATWFLVNTGTGTDRVALGDITGAYNLTKLIVDDGAEKIFNQTNNDFVIQDSSGDIAFHLFTGTGNTSVEFGAIGYGNHTTLSLNDTGSQVAVNANSGFYVADVASHMWFNANPNNFEVQLGDISGSNNATTLTVNDTDQYAQVLGSHGLNVAALGGNNHWLNIDPANLIAEMGDLDGSHERTTLVVNDSTQTISFASSNNGLYETTVSSDIPHRVAVTVTSSEFKSLTSASVPLVSAPPSGYFIHIVDLSVETIFGTTAYTLGATHPGIGYGGSAQYIFKNATLDAAWTATSTQFAPISGNSLASTTTAYDGQPLDIFSGDDPTLGDGTFTIYITYQILKD